MSCLGLSLDKDGMADTVHVRTSDRGAASDRCQGSIRPTSASLSYVGACDPMDLIPTLLRRMSSLRDGVLRPVAMRPLAPTRYDRAIDGLNRLPRPVMALGVVALFAAAMIAPEWFAIRMQALSHVPEPLWWLLGVVVSFYFGARCQIKAQTFRRELADAQRSAPPKTDTPPSRAA